LREQAAPRDFEDRRTNRYEKLAQLGLDTVAGSPEDLATIIKGDIVKWAKVIKDAGIKADE
jgi:tripartite-type tricarboxylate transporter receptor subunit TctC